MTQPPLTNRGAEITSPPCSSELKILFPSDNRMLIDWVAGTFTDIENPVSAIKRLGLDDSLFIAAPKGMQGYKQMLYWGNIKVLFDGRRPVSEDQKPMGVHFVLSGEGCRQYESQFSESPWLKLFDDILKMNGNICRLDIAHDNVDGALRLDLLEDAILNHEVRTRFKRARKISDMTYHDSDLSPIGKTICLSSSRQSLVYPRFYDKAAQYDLSGHWVRAELELKDDRALRAVQYLLQGMEIGELFGSILNSCFTVINLDDTNKSRCSVQSWWATWLQCTNKIKLSVEKMRKTVEHAKDWFKRSVSPSLAMIRKSYQGDDNSFADWMREIFDYGKSRLTPRHQQILLLSGVGNLPF